MKKRNAFVLTLIALIFSSPLLAQNPPSSIEELRTLPNANRYWRAGLTQSPYAATLSNGIRVIYTFSEGESGYPYLKRGKAAPICSNRLNNDCMMGVINIVNFEWFTYWRTSDRSKFWLCMIYHSGSEPWFRCDEAQAGRSNTVPEVYNITVIAGIRFVGQLPSQYIEPTPEPTMPPEPSGPTSILWIGFIEARADIFIDGILKARNKNTFFDSTLTPGPHVIRIEGAPGFATIDTTLILKAGQHENFFPQLIREIENPMSDRDPEPTAPPEPSKPSEPISILVVSVSEGHADIFIDGILKARRDSYTPPDTLTPGPHTIRVERNDFDTFETTITLEAGEKRFFTPSLRRKKRW